MTKMEQLIDQATEDIMGVKILNKKIFSDLLIKECVKVLVSSNNAQDQEIAEHKIKEYFQRDV